MEASPTDETRSDVGALLLWKLLLGLTIGCRGAVVSTRWWGNNAVGRTVVTVVVPVERKLVVVCKAPRDRTTLKMVATAIAADLGDLIFFPVLKCS